jgi:RNA polymerase sigma-70 factor (ECF subfamily)
VSSLDVHLAAIQAGDAHAFARWLAGSETRLRLSLRRFAAQVDVEAVMQETLLRVWQVAPRIEPDGRDDCLLRFAIRVGRNVALSEMRRLHRPTAAIAAAAEDAERVEAVETDPLLRRVIAACCEELPPRPAAALEQRLESGGSEPDRELAARLGMQLNTFLQNVTRARKLLGQCLERQGVRLQGVLG